MTLDYPEQTEQSDALMQQNRTLEKKFKVDFFPTLLLLDSNGRPYAESQIEFDLAAHLALLKDLCKKKTTRDNAFTAAKELEGMKKAAKLSEALLEMKIEPYFIAEFYAPQLARIAKADPADKLGITKMIETGTALITLQEDLPAFHEAKDWDGGINRVDQYIKTYKPTGEALQKVLGNKLFLYEFKGDFPAAVVVCEQIIKIDPESDTGVNAKVIKQNFLRDIPEKGEKEVE